MEMETPKQVIMNLLQAQRLGLTKMQVTLRSATPMADGLVFTKDIEKAMRHTEKMLAELGGLGI